MFYAKLEWVNGFSHRVPATTAMGKTLFDDFANEKDQPTTFSLYPELEKTLCPWLSGESTKVSYYDTLCI